MTNAIIVDDERHGRETLATLLEQHCRDVHILASLASVRDAGAAIRSLRPDLVFLDIEMPDGSGFQLLQSLEVINFAVVFVTAYEQYAIRALRFAAADYLLKPLNSVELRAAMRRVSQSVGGAPTAGQRSARIRGTSQGAMAAKIALPTEDGSVFIDIDAILRCQAASNYTRVFLAGGEEFIVSRTLGEFEQLLADADFERVHNSHLVNLSYIRRYRKGKTGRLELSDGTVVDVAASRKERLFSRFERRF